MLGHDRRHQRQIDLLGYADDLDEKVPVQGAAAAHAPIRTMIGDWIEVIAQHAAMALVTGLGAARLGLVPPVLAIGERRLRGRERGLLPGAGAAAPVRSILFVAARRRMRADKTAAPQPSLKLQFLYSRRRPTGKACAS